VTDQPIHSDLSIPRGIVRMVAPRAIYFFYFAALANLIPYLALYYQSLGLSGLQIGVLTGISPLIGWVAGPFWGAVADATQRHKLILIFTIAAASVAALLLGAVTVFALLVLFVMIYAFFNAPIIPLVDNSVVEQLGGRRQEYGKQRVWGTYGWGLASLAIGWLIQQFGLPVIFYGFAILLSFGLLAAVRFPVSQAPIAVKFDRHVWKLFANRRWLSFLGVMMILGAGMAMVGNYFVIYLKSLGTPAVWIGVALALASVSEIPALFYSDRLIRRFGILGLLVIGGVVFGLRALVFSVASAPWQALGLQFVHGFTYALVLVAGVEYASQLAPPGMGATAQGLFGGVLNGLGIAIGALLGGVLMDAIGIRGMYRVAGVSALLAVALFLIASRSKSMRSSNVGGE
jgi:MFS transporter, PPP family, 3-phenylpropionic acid transporter